MQLRTHLTKLFILVFVSCSLLVWEGTTLDVANLADYGANETSVAQPSNTVWHSIRSGFSLDTKTQTSQVRNEIRKLLADQKHLRQILTDAAPYIYYIHQRTRAYGLPAELALIPFIESEFNPNDKSKKGALGLWQLMRGTAHELGIKVGSGYDGRRNVVASTNAALAYFRDLGNDFNGNWYLAIAAYNCGQGKVQSVVRRTGSKNFWNLSTLPSETKCYVPKLLAIAEIIKHPAKYGVQLPEIVNKPYFVELKVKKSVNITKIAKSSGITTKTMNALNPDGIGVPKKTPHEKSYTLLVPIDKAPAAKANIGTPNIVAS